MTRIFHQFLRNIGYIITHLFWNCQLSLDIVYDFVMILVFGVHFVVRSGRDTRCSHLHFFPAKSASFFIFSLQKVRISTFFPCKKCESGVLYLGCLFEALYSQEHRHRVGILV